MSNIRRTTSSELPIQGPKPEPARNESKPTPHINQLQPQGADRNYVNGAYNCAPAVVAMLARSKGKMSHLNDAQLITELGKGLVTKDGTTPEGVARMLGRANLPLAGDALAGKYDEAAVQKHLQQGNQLIAQVGLKGEQGKPDSAHYVLVKGMTRDGNYVVSDPLAKRPYSIRPDQLRSAVNRAPPDGGLLIPVGTGNTKSATAKAVPGTSPSLASRAVTQPSMQAVGASAFMRSRAVTQPSMQALGESGFQPAVGRTVTQPSMRAFNPVFSEQPAAAEGIDTRFSSPTMAALNPATLGVTNGAFKGATTAPVSPSVPLTPTADPFAVPDSALAGIDTTFHELPLTKQDTALSSSEKRNLAALDIDYGKKSAPAVQKGAPQVTPDNATVKDFGQKLRDQKRKDDPTVHKLLERLENSRSDKDRKVLSWLKRMDLRDPGIGKKTWTESYGD